MAENSKIGWTDCTFNPFIGCTQVSPGCDNCYARDLAARYGWAEWGTGKPRHRTSKANWRKPISWDRAAAETGVRPKVFCASLADVFDTEVPDEWRADLWELIEHTPNLDWLLLTKRHARLKKDLPDEPFDNVRIGVTVEDEAHARMRLPWLGGAGLDGWQTFISYEPAIGPVNWEGWLDRDGLYAECFHWLISGAESGPNRRRFTQDWARAARDACQANGIPYFHKQEIIDGKKIELPELDGVSWAQFPKSAGAA